MNESLLWWKSLIRHDHRLLFHEHLMIQFHILVVKEQESLLISSKDPLSGRTILVYRPLDLQKLSWPVKKLMIVKELVKESLSSCNFISFLFLISGSSWILCSCSYRETRKMIISWNWRAANPWIVPKLPMNDVNPIVGPASPGIAHKVPQSHKSLVF